MSRVARAAVRLRQDIEALFPKAEVEVTGEADGLGVYRTLRVDRKTAERLTPEVVTLADNGRIQSAEIVEDYLDITVIAGPRADLRDGFPLAAALEVVESRDPEPEPVKKTAAKKTAAKKTAAKKPSA